ncbi:unnamed protein product [Fraxinus pennsylvanica]|uniref:Uncharacterized protein n=1 Tax=Fraxinus pennsylvanica TaxID=56036 RepID=A0AAD2A7D2_9LAMI|nr:unnamed protein product [Fraxinus pennsylvanica]
MTRQQQVTRLKAPLRAAQQEGDREIGFGRDLVCKCNGASILSELVKHVYSENITVAVENESAAATLKVEVEGKKEDLAHRRLKKGAISAENYARRMAQNKEFCIVDNYIRGSSGWEELDKNYP